MNNITLTSDKQTIRLTQSERVVKLVQSTNEISLSQSVKAVKLVQVKSRSAILEQLKHAIKFTQPNLRGLPGANGVGVPEGGSPGEVVTKTENGTEWRAFEGADKNYTQTFTNQSDVTIEHNLNKYPSVTVIDSADDIVVGDVVYLGLNTIRLLFSSSFSGRVTCN